MPSFSMPVKVHVWLLRSSELLFPAVTELQIILAITIAVTLVVLDPHLATGVVAAIRSDIRTVVFLLPIVFVVGAVLRKKTLSDDTKVMASTLYFTFFALLALAALSTQGNITAAAWSFIWINGWLIRIFFGLALLRALIYVIAMRIDNPVLSRRITQNFRDTQYSLWAFAGVLVAGILGVILLRRAYSDAAMAGVLAFTYTNILIGFITALRGNITA